MYTYILDVVILETLLCAMAFMTNVYNSTFAGNTHSILEFQIFENYETCTVCINHVSK